MKSTTKIKIIKESTSFKIDKSILDKFNKLMIKRQLFEEKNGKLISRKVTTTRGIEEALNYFIEKDINPVEYIKNDHTSLLTNLDNNMFKLRDNVFSFMTVQEKKMFDKFNLYDNYFTELNKLFAFSNQRQILTHDLLLSLIDSCVDDNNVVVKIKKDYKSKLDKAKEMIK